MGPRESREAEKFRTRLVERKQQGGLHGLFFDVSSVT